MYLYIQAVPILCNNLTMDAIITVALKFHASKSLLKLKNTSNFIKNLQSSFL